MNQVQPNYYAVIPASVRYDNTISANAKLLYGELTALSNEKGYCWATNDYFAKLYKKHKYVISRWVKQLIDRSLIRIEADNDIRQTLINKRLDGFGIGDQKCEWCNINTYVLHKHHYPIPKARNGKQVVRICPNCHHEFHNSPYQIVLNLNDCELIDLNTFKRELGVAI